MTGDIVTTHYRYKRPPKKRKPNPAALAMPRIVTAKTPKPGRAPIAAKSSRHRDRDGQMAAEVNLSIAPSEAQAQSAQRETAVNTAENSYLPKEERRSAIVTIRSRKHARFANVPDVTPEEHKLRGDAADALFREMKRRIAEKLR